MAQGQPKPGNELQTYVVDALIQGVTQQSAWDRRDTQCESQFDCVNSPVNGVEARPGFDFLSLIGNRDHTASFCYEIFRGDEEHYLVVIDAVPDPQDGHRLHVYDLNTGLQCNVTYTAPETYLECTANDPSVSLMATSLEDFTFIGNREVTCRMSTTLKSAAKPNEGILFFKAGAYSTVFQVAVTYGGFIYTWTYTTPDNSTVTNAPYISTNNLAAAFFRSFTGVDAVVTATGTTVDSSHIGVGAAGSGTNTGTQAGADTLTGLGFYVKLNGNVILIGRTDNSPFVIDTGDGVGDTYLRGCKDKVQNFTDLPRSCFKNFIIKVAGSNEQNQQDYWVQFQGADGSTGYWEEVVAPGLSLTFENTTMPLALVNNAVNTFTLQYPLWQNRVSGDGAVTALDPSFIGKSLQDMSFDHGRLLLMSEGSAVWSRPRNVFVFFPDTAQTVLDTDPIDVRPGGGKTIALLRRIIQVGEVSMLWAEKIQFRATSGVNPFKQDTVELPPSANYEFSSKVAPKAVGQSLYFVTETGLWSTIRDLAFQNQLPVGATDITAHVKKYIPSGMRWMTASDTLGHLFGATIGAPTNLYCYNYLLGSSSRLQSAWNTWRLPSNSSVLWTGMSLNYLYALVQREGGACIIRCDLTIDLTDPGGEYLTRLDFRVTEAQCTMAYNAGTDTTTITLPYLAPEASSWVAGQVCPFMVINRDSTGTRRRGHSWLITAFPSLTQVAVKGDCRGDHFYAGFRIRSERTNSRFYLKTTRGLVPCDNLRVEDLRINYGAGTGYFRMEVNYVEQGAEQVVHDFNPVEWGAADIEIGNVPTKEGTFKGSIQAENTKHSVTLVNDSFLPSRWVSMEYAFNVAFVAKPSPYGQSVPSYFAQGGTSGAANNF